MTDVQGPGAPLTPGTDATPPGASDSGAESALAAVPSPAPTGDPQSRSVDSRVQELLDGLRLEPVGHVLDMIEGWIERHFSTASPTE